MAQFQFKRTGDSDYPRHLKILLQGPPKSGKTTFLSTAPNIIVAAVEAGLMSIAHLDVPYVEIDGTDKLQTLHTVLGDETMRAKTAKQLGLPKVETVAIDTLDAWQEMLKKEILRENRRTSMQQADWGTLKERMSAILKAFVALPINVIFTVHTSTTQDDESRLIYAPALQGSIKDDVAGYVDFSLLTFRDRQVDAQGNPRIAYFLKNEGDLKNPSLGNRAAGRVPEISEPNFKTLYDAVFLGIKRDVPSQNPTEITVDAPTPVAAPQPTTGITMTNLPEPEQPAQQSAQPAAQTPVSQANGAQTVSTGEASSQTEQTPAPAPQPSPQPTEATTPGVPLSDDDKPINASGLQVLTKHYMAHSMVLPADIKEWTLGKARMIAKWFVAVKADALAGQVTERGTIIDYLKAYDAYAGDLPGVQTGVENVQTPPKPTTETAGEVTPSAPGADATSTSDEQSQEKIEADAVALVKQELGGVEIGREVVPGTKCATCGEEVDDVDIANLAMTRFGKPLCVKDYKTESKQKASV